MLTTSKLILNPWIIAHMHTSKNMIKPISIYWQKKTIELKIACWKVVYANVVNFNDDNGKVSTSLWHDKGKVGVFLNTKSNFSIKTKEPNIPIAWILKFLHS
jgi:hypothetical protein